jgi:Flp pilus assembly protein TadD
LREDPPYQLSLYERAIEQLLLGSTTGASALAAEYRQRHGETLTQVQLEASCWFHDEASANAEALYRRAARLNPADPILYRNLGWIAMRRGDEAGACALWMKALALDPSDPELAALVRPLLLKKAEESVSTD